MWGSKPSQQWENFFGIIVLQLWVAYPVGMGFDFIVIVPFQPSHCGFLSLDMRFPFFFFFFLVSSSILLSTVIHQLVVILVFSQEDMSTHPSSLPY